MCVLAANLGNEDEDKVSVISDLESILTFYCKSKSLKYEKGNGWIEILLPLIALKLPRSETYNLFEAIKNCYIPRFVRLSAFLLQVCTTYRLDSSDIKLIPFKSKYLLGWGGSSCLSWNHRFSNKFTPEYYWSVSIVFWILSASSHMIPKILLNSSTPSFHMSSIFIFLFMWQTKFHAHVKEQVKLQFCIFESLCLLIVGVAKYFELNGSEHSLILICS